MELDGRLEIITILAVEKMFSHGMFEMIVVILSLFGAPLYLKLVDDLSSSYNILWEELLPIIFEKNFLFYSCISCPVLLLSSSLHLTSKLDQCSIFWFTDILFQNELLFFYLKSALISWEFSFIYVFPKLIVFSIQ